MIGAQEAAWAAALAAHPDTGCSLSEPCFPALAELCEHHYHLDIRRQAHAQGWLNRETTANTATWDQVRRMAVAGFESPDYNDMSFSKLPEWSQRSKIRHMALILRAAGITIIGGGDPDAGT